MMVNDFEKMGILSEVVTDLHIVMLLNS